MLNFPENANGYGRNSSMNLSNSNNTVITWVRKNSNGNNGRTVTAQSNNWLLDITILRVMTITLKGGLIILVLLHQILFGECTIGTGHIANDVWQLYVNTTLEASNNGGGQGPNGWNFTINIVSIQTVRLLFLLAGIEF